MLWAVVAIAVDRKAATVVDDKGTPLHGRGKNLLQSLVDVLAQVREGLGSIGEAIVVSVGIHSEQNVVGLLSLLSSRTTGISEGVFSEEVLNLVQCSGFRVRSRAWASSFWVSWSLINPCPVSSV